MITIRHTRAEGTLIEGSHRGDGVWEVLRDQRSNWRSSRSVGLYLGQSRDKAAKTWIINAAAEALREAGFEVAVEIDNLTPGRSTEEAERERYERAEERADRFEEYGENAAGRSHAAWQRADQIGERFAGGQPILVGHHSERGARRDQQRMDDAMRRSIAEDDKAGHWAERAEAAGKYQARRENARTTLRRIQGLEREERSWQAALDGTRGSRTLHGDQDEYVPASGRYRERVLAELAQIREQLTYWRGHVEKRKAEGVRVWSPADFKPGDYASSLWGWCEVIKVNAKSLTIPDTLGMRDGIISRADHEAYAKAHGWERAYTRTVPYDKITGHATADEAAHALADAKAKEGAA